MIQYDVSIHLCSSTFKKETFVSRTFYGNQNAGPKQTVFCWHYFRCNNNRSIFGSQNVSVEWHYLRSRPIRRGTPIIIDILSYRAAAVASSTANSQISCIVGVTPIHVPLFFGSGWARAVSLRQKLPLPLPQAPGIHARVNMLLHCFFALSSARRELYLRFRRLRRGYIFSKWSRHKWHIKVGTCWRADVGLLVRAPYLWAAWITMKLITFFGFLIPDMESMY